MVGAANIFTHVGEGDSWALMGGLGNVFTKIGDGNALALMIAEVNVFTHIGNGTTVALMLAKGNIATKVGNGMTMAAMVGNANIFTHVGDGDTFAAMIGQANILTKVGNDLTAALMVGQANIYTHVGDGTSIGILAGEANIMTKVGDGTTLAAMFGKANIMTHVGDGLSGVLALGQANIVTKVGDGFMGVVAAAKANVVTHVGDGTTAAVMLGEGNILTKVGDGTTVGLLISKVGNIMTHVGDGMTIGVAKGKANIITKVGDGLGVNVAWGEANILTHVGDGDRYNFAKGKANIITKVGDGQEVSVVHGKANIITHVGDGDDYTGAWGEANIITKVGDGRNVVLAKGNANIVTQIGDGDSFNALWSKGNIVTKVGDGMQVTAAKGKANIVTTIGNGLSVTATYGDLNINTKVGDGISVNVAWGKYNINTKVGDGLNVAMMKGKANANIQVGDGLGINASYAQNNVAIKIGNGDFYSLSVASSNTKSNKLSSLFDNIKQTVLGMAGSQGINFLVQGDDASTSASRKGRGAIATPEITKLNGFQMEEIAEVGSELGDSMSGGVTDVETPDVAAMKSELNVDEDAQSTENPNLIANGDFEQGAQGWLSTNGIEASYSGSVYGVDNAGHGAIVNELATNVNTTIYQDIQSLESGEVLSLSFDFVQRAGLSAGHGMQVLWNGSIVFSASGDESTWQQQTLQLTAQTGNNRIEFKGTGESNGLGYILDNVVAKSEKIAATSAVSDNAQQNKAAANAQNDKEKAEADAQRLQQEKDQQLAAVSGSQKQLEATDQNALKTNGQAEREALAAEQRDITKELTDLTQGLDALDGQDNYQGESGDSWRDNFAGGILDNVQSKLNDAKSNSNEQLDKAAQQNKKNQQDTQAAVAKSESGVAKGEENQANAQQDINDAKASANSRQDEALVKQQDALQAKTNANADTNQAQQRGEQDSSAAQNKSSQAQADAKGTKQDEDDKPDRNGASGSGLSGKAYEAQAAAENTSHVDAHSEAAADGRYSEGLTEQELEALEGAKEAVNRLQINAGVRIKNVGSSVTDKFSNAISDKPMVSDVVASGEVRRNEQQISGVNLQGLGNVLGDSAVIMKAVKGFDFYLLAADDSRFTDSTKRHIGKLSTDLPSNELKAVRGNVLAIQNTPSEVNLANLEQALQQWQETNPNEFAERSKLIKSLQFEVASLQSHIQTHRAKEAGVLGMAIDPKNAETFESKVVFDGIGRVAGLVEPLAADELSLLKSHKVVSLTQTNSTADRETVKTENESIIEFVYKLSQVDEIEVKELADQAKALWISGQVTHETTVALFTEAHDKLAAYPELQTLTGKLLVDAQKEKATSQYIDNLFGRRFDSEIAHELVKTPTEEAVNTSVQIGVYLVKDFDEWMHSILPDSADDTLRGDRIQKKMQVFAETINSDSRPWFSRVPTLAAFLETPNYDNFKIMMTQVDDGFGVIKVPFLAVKMAIAPGMGMEMAPWKAEGDRFYQNVIVKARSTNTVISSGSEGENEVKLVERKTSDYGTALHYQPKGETYEDFQEGRSVADGRILTPGKETTFESNALNKNLSVVTGASGSTNIMVHLNQYLASKIPAFSSEQAYLNTLAFLVFDGGHSINESLAVYKALQETGEARKTVLESYTANYQDLVTLVGDDSKEAVRTALDNAFAKTIDFYKEHAHSASEELEALGSKRQIKRINESVLIENDGTQVRDESSLNPLTRFLNNELYGNKDARRKIGDITQTLLDHAVTDGKSDKVTLKGESGRLSGYYHHGNTLEDTTQAQDTSQKVVLFVHGSGSSAEEQTSAVRLHYQKQGIDMLAVNMRGYGASDGGPNEKGLYQDARTMFSYLVNDKGIDPSNIIIHGYSLGGPIAADLAHFSALNNKAVSGLLLDRPMPSMTKAITAHEVVNPAGIVGALSKIVNGQFSVEKNLKGLPKETPIMLLTDNEGLGNEGEKLRAKLAADGYQVSGENTFYGHEASNRLMSQYAKEIVSDLFDAKAQTVEELESLGNKAKQSADLSEVFTKDQLKKNAKVFAKPIGVSYQKILDQVGLVHSTTGRDQIAASFELNKHIDAYVEANPASGRNQAFNQLKGQITNALFNGDIQVAKEGISEIAQTRPELAARIYIVAQEEANGKNLGLTDLMVRWAKEDPYLSAKNGYQGDIPSDLGFEAKFHVELGSQYADFKQTLEKAQTEGLLTKAVIDESTKTVHLGYTYQELQDQTGTESVQMAAYFLKEAAKKSDPTSADSAEMILLNKFADKNYITELERQRMDQIESIYRSSHDTDIAAWDKRYSGTALNELNSQLGAATSVEAQLALLLEKRNGLLIGESHGSDVNGLRFVNEQMDALKAQGVSVIGLEHLRADLAQPLIDSYLSSGDMSSELRIMLKTKHLDISLFENARAKGLRIVALDANSTTRPTIQGTEHGLMYRAGAANNVAVETLSGLPAGEKFVAIYGNAHLQSHKGIEGFVPGITHRLDLPGLKISETNQFKAQADDLSQRVIYGDVLNKAKIEFTNSLNSDDGKVQKNNVESWDKVTVTQQNDGGDTRFDGQLIIQTENDPAAAKAAANLAGKHPDSSVVVQLDADGKYRVVYGDPSKLAGKLRWQIVGHGRDASDNNNTRLSGYNATELAANLVQFNEDFSQAKNINSKPEYISIVGCSLISTDKQKGFAKTFITTMAESDIRADVSARSSEVAIDSTGHKHTRDADDQWAKKLVDNKVVLSWNDQGDVTVREETVRNTIAEGDIDLSRIGLNENDGVTRGAIADNDDVFTAPEKRKDKIETSSSNKSDNKVSYSGNIQVNVGDGEFTALNWGTSNVGIKVGTGGFKSLAFGDNNVMVHIGNGDSKHSVDMGGYQALEGAQMFIGNRNVSFNMGRSNDLIVMMDKSIPTPPLVNPFDGAARISGVLQSISESGKDQDWLAAQDSQWTLAGAKKFVKDMSGLDQTSSVDYTTLGDLDSQNERSSRGLKSDTEAALNKKYNEWLGGNKSSDTSKMSRSDKFRQKNEELAFNLAVGGRGADIQITTGNWNFMFGDNIHSILDTNLGSLFGLMTQQFSASGKAETTFTYNPQDLPRQLKNKLLGKLAGVGADTTLADIFAVDYTADGQIVARNGEAVDSVAILTEMVEVVAEFGGDQLKSFIDPSTLLDSLKSSLDMGKDGLNTFVESHGLKDKAPESLEDKSTVSVNSETDAEAKTIVTDAVIEKEERPFGFNALNLPNLFATIFSSDKQSEMKSLVTNLKGNLTADLLNMKEATFDFLRNSGHLQGDGDVNVSLGNYNFNWGGDGKDLGAYLGDNNNFWGGRGDDVYYATGTSNIFTGGDGNDMGVLMGRENMMFGGDGDDTAVVAGRINHVFMGDGNDQAFVFGEGGTIESGSGRDYVVTSGNYNAVQAGDDQDYVVTIGNNNQIDLGNGDDFSNVFGNYNKIDGKAGNDVIKLMGYHAVIDAGADDDHLIAASVSKYSEIDGGEGNDLLVLGGYSNNFQGGTGIDSFMVNVNVIDNQVTDISKDDFIVFNDVNWNDLWLQRNGEDLQIKINRKVDYTSAQAKFESIGLVTFTGYFADNRAELVISMDAKQESGERDYTALSNGAVDNLVQAMSGFEPSAGDAGFMDQLDNGAKHKIALAWGNVNKGTGHIA